MSTFDASAAYAAFLDALAPSFEPAGFKRVKNGFRRRTRFAQLDVPLSTSRDSRPDCLICNLGGTASLKALDPFFRPKDASDSLTGGKGCDFFITQVKLIGEPGRWDIASDAALADAIGQAKHCVPALSAWFEPFEAEDTILARLRERFLVRDASATNILGKLPYPAYLAGTGRVEEFHQAFADLLALFADNERFVLAINRARQKIERVSGIGHA